MRSNLGSLCMLYQWWLCFLIPTIFSRVSVIALNGIIIESCSEENGPSPVDVKGNKSLGLSEQTLTSLWSSSKWMLHLALTWVLCWRWPETIWQIFTAEWTKEAKIPHFSPFWFSFLILDQESCSNLNAGCTHQCVQGPFGAQCICPEGYLLANDSKTCEDIDECDIPGFCSQHCYNTRGSFRCWCDKEYMLDTDGKTCKVTGND